MIDPRITQMVALVKATDELSIALLTKLALALRAGADPIKVAEVLENHRDGLQASLDDLGDLI